MHSFAGDEDDVESGGSPNGSSDNDQDLEMEGEGDLEADGYADAENDEENDENDDDDEEQDQEESQDSFGDVHSRDQTKNVAKSSVSLLGGVSASTQGSGAPASSGPTSHPNPTVMLTSPSPTQTPSATLGSAKQPLQAPPEALTAPVYDIVPTIAAPHSTSINSITATPDLRWVFSGGADGYIRKFNWIETVNGKSMLTVAQRHPFVDSVTKAGVLMSYWENDDSQAKSAAGDDGPYLSSVYSLAVQRDGLWLLSGLESGGINLQSVRHDEGKQIACLRQHTSAVSVLNLAQDERSVLSGSWDKSIIDWDLNTGQAKRKFEGSGGQISALEIRPSSSLPVPEASGEIQPSSGTISSNNTNKPVRNGYLPNGDAHGSKEDVSQDYGMANTSGSPADSLFGGSLFGDNEDGENAAPSGGNFVDDDDDDFSRAVANGVQGEENVDAEGDVDMTDGGALTVPSNDEKTAERPLLSTSEIHEPTMGNIEDSQGPTKGLPHAEELTLNATTARSSTPAAESELTADTIFLAASFDGSLRIWDKRRPTPVAKIPPRNVPPWCMNACWSPNGNFIYAGRRNGTVEEFSLHKGLTAAERSFKLPNGSGPVSTVRAMPNGRHLICASYDILRLYDLEQQQTFKHCTVPFLIVPGHRTGVVSQLFIDPTCRYMISTAGNRGWEGNSTEVLLGYEIGVGK